MLEGLEVSELLISEVKLDNLNIRLDSEYFKKEYLNFFKSVPNLSPLSTFVAEGYRVIYENTNVVSADVGVANDYPIFLQATDLATPFIKTDDFYYVHEKDWLRYPKGRIKAGELLIEVKGKIDKVSIVPNDFPKKALVTGSIYKLSVNEKINKHYLLTYLICKYGSAFKDRYKTNLLISFVSKDDLYRIPVPTFSFKFESQIEIIFNKIFNFRKQSLSTYSQAESLLLETLGMTNFAPRSESINIKSFKDSFASSGRMDAEYYQPKYEALLKLLKRDGLTIGDMATVRNERFKPNLEGNFEYIEIGGLNGDGTVSAETTLHIAAPSRASQLVRNGDIVTSTVRPIRRLTGLIAPEHEASVCSSGFVVLNPQHIAAEVLLVFLRIPLICELLDLQTSATMYPAISEKDLLAIPIHKIKPSIQTQIAELVQHSFKLKIESERLLEVAKSAVEVAIEQDEAAGMAYLKGNS